MSNDGNRCGEGGNAPWPTVAAMALPSELRASIWVAHFRSGNSVLESLVTTDRILCHPLIVIELACGTPPAPRERTLGDLRKLRQAVLATTDETLALIQRKQCHDSGCGAVDIALLASVLLTADARLWTIEESRCIGHTPGRGLQRCQPSVAGSKSAGQRPA